MVNGTQRKRTIALVGHRFRQTHADAARAVWLTQSAECPRSILAWQEPPAIRICVRVIRIERDAKTPESDERSKPSAMGGLSPIRVFWKEADAEADRFG